MPAIIFSRILSLGEEYDVFSLGKMPESPERYADIRGRVRSIFILPSVFSDLRMEIPDLNAERLFSYAPPALACARFLRTVRGLPLREITVETPLGEITVLSGNDGKCSLLSERFTVVAEDFLTLLSEKIRARTLISPFGKIRTLKVSSAENFSRELLCEASLSRSGEELIGAVAYDDGGDVIYHFSKNGEYPSAFTAAVAAVSSLQKENISVRVGEDLFDFSYFESHLSVYDSAGVPLTFFAPDI